MADDLQLGITVEADIQNAISDLQDLIDTLLELPDTIDTEVDVSGLSNISSEASEASSDIEGLDTSTTNLGGNLGDLSGELEETGKKTDDLGQQATQATSGISGMSDAMGALAGLGIATTLDEASNSAGNFSDNWNRIGIQLGEAGETSKQVESEFSGSMEEMEKSTGRGKVVIQEALLGMSVAGIKNKDVMKQGFEAIAGASYGSGIAIDQVSKTYDKAVQTGMIGNRQLMSMGISTQDVFNATGMSVKDLAKKFKEATPEQRAYYMDQILNAKYGQKANDDYMKSWQKTRDSFKEAGTEFLITIGNIILPILIPALTQLTGLAKSLGGVLTGLPAPVKDLAGGFLLFGGGLLSAYLILKPFYTAFVGIRTVISSVISALTGSAVATDADTASKEANTGATGENAIAQNEGIISRIRGTASTIAGTVAQTANTIATEASAVAWDMLNMAMDANPIGIIIIAVMALAGGLIYLWETNEGFRNSVLSTWNAIVSTVMPVLQALYSGLAYLGGAISNMDSLMANARSSFVSALTSMLTGAISSLSNYLGKITGLGGKSGMDFVKSFLVFMVTLPARIPIILATVLIAITNWVGSLTGLGNNVGSNFVNSVIEGLSQLPGLIWNFLMQAITLVNTWNTQLSIYALIAGLKFISSIRSGIASLPSVIWTYLANAISRFLNFNNTANSIALTAGRRIYSGIQSGIAGIPGMVYNELLGVGNLIRQAGSYLYSQATSVGTGIYNSIKNALGIHSPGYIYWMIHDELGRVDKLMTASSGILGKTASGIGNSIVSNFNGNLANLPKLNNNSMATINVQHTLDLKNAPPGITNNGVASILNNQSQLNQADYVDNLLGKKLNLTRLNLGG